MLSAISGYSDLLLADVASPAPIDRDEIRECAQAVHDAAARAATLTSQLLAFSRQQIVQPRVIDLAKGVAGLEPMLARLIGERVRLDLRLDADTGRIRIDPGQLDQIVVNLVVNARDAIPAGGTITVETSRTTLSEPYAAEHFEVIPGPYAMLAVSDNGMGMDVETRKHIFEPFYTTKERGRGTGLGLATIYGIVRQSGGHIWLYSEPGIGSTFKLFFPRAEADVDRDEPAPATPDLGSGTILLVEDEDAVRDIVRRILERAGYRVVAMADAPAALEVVRGRGEQIAALVSDVVMPGLMGTELADFVRRERPEIGIVLLSGYTAETLDLADLLARGARFLSKPFAPDALIREVGEAIAAATRSSSRES
jgi:CheY-like chemotaxis protein